MGFRRIAAFACALFIVCLLPAGARPMPEARAQERAALAVPEDRFWDDIFELPGGAIYQPSDFNALALAPDGDLYAAGSSVRRWDGRRWHAVGTNQPAGTIYQLAFVGDTLYAGGWFDTAGGQTVNNLARWDGTSWRDVGGGVTNGGAGAAVSQLLVRNGRLYITGTFDRAGSIAANGWAVWDGNAWAAPEGAGAAGAPADVGSITFDGGMLYASSAFSETGRFHGRILRWDGAAWTQMGPAFDVFYPTFVHGMQWYAGQLYITGAFQLAGDPETYYVARWDGTRWQGIGTPAQVGGVVDEMIIRGGLLYFANISRTGQRALLTWNGSAWNRTGPIANPSNSEQGFVFIKAFAQTGAQFYIGGLLENIKDSQGNLQTINHAAQLIDGEWHPLGHALLSTGPANANSILAVGEEVYAFGRSGRTQVWNGRYWRNLTSTLPYETFASDGSTLYAHDSARIFRRTGAAWTAIGVPNGPPAHMRGGPSGLYVAGAFTAIDGVAVKGLARWDGASWHAVGDSAVGGAISAMHVTVGGSYIGGAFTAIGSVSANHIARWDGAAWRALGAGIPESEISVIVGDNADLYALSHTAESSFIRHWDGAEWTMIVTTSRDALRSIAVLDGELVAGGRFDSIGGVAAQNIARWDGAAWRPLGSGLAGYLVNAPMALTTIGHNLYVYSDYSVAGGWVSPSFARWNDHRTPIFIPAVLR
ncbi:MAG TPA: hypothetical protein VGE07_27130 [Herpetosiphonaceae bacterium]